MMSNLPLEKNVKNNTVRLAMAMPLNTEQQQHRHWPVPQQPGKMTMTELMTIMATMTAMTAMTTTMTMIAP